MEQIVYALLNIFAEILLATGLRQLINKRRSSPPPDHPNDTQQGPPESPPDPNHQGNMTINLYGDNNKIYIGTNDPQTTYQNNAKTGVSNDEPSRSDQVPSSPCRPEAEQLETWETTK